MMRLFKGIREGNTYACTAGEHLGTMLIYIESTKSDHGFLKIPTMEKLWVPREQVDIGLKDGILEFVERVPRYVRKITKNQFREIKN